MRRSLLLASVASALVCGPLAHAADDPLELVRAGKKATALVVLPDERGFGSAFCIDKGGFFVTNEHVARGLPAGRNVSLVLNPAEEGERVVEASVVRVDAAADLALVRVADPKGLTPLELGSSDGLIETQTVTAFGYPFGDRLAARERKYPSISVNVGRVTALRRAKAELDAIQVDAQLNPGNSGGPVLDAKGRVVGVVTSGVRGAGVNFAVPVSKVHAFLKKPEVVFAPPPVPFAKRHDPTKFTVRLVSFATPAPKVAVEIVLTVGGAERKVVATPGADGAYTADVVLVPAPVGPKRVPVTLIFPSGRIQGTVEDRAFKIGAESFWLSEVREVNPGARATVVTKAGREVAGVASDLGTVPAEFGGYTLSVALGKATRVVAEYAETVVDQVEYVVNVTEGGKALAQLKGAIRVEGAPGPAAAPAARIDAPALATDKTVVTLPSSFEDVWVGGGGRYLILHMRRLGKLAVFDVSAAKVVQYIPAPADATGAAGAESLVVILHGKKVIERWSLLTFEKEASAPLPVDFPIDRVSLGSGSHGPILVWGEQRNSALLDLGTLKKLPTQIEPLVSGRVAPHDLRLEAAPDGSAFAVWFRKQHMDEPARFGVLRLDGDRPTMKTGLSRMRPCLASIDGGPAFTGEGNVYTADMQPIPAPELKNASLLPFGSSYVVAARWEGPERKARLAVHFMNTLKEAFPVGDAEELDGLVADNNDPSPFSYDKRIQFVPSANVLLTLPATNDRVVVRRLDVDAALKKFGGDYLFVSSVPVRRAAAGASYAYPIEVKSKRDDVRFELDSGPKGMTVSRTGRLTWDVPAGPADAAVIVSVTDGGGQKLFHAFTIRVR